MSLERGVLSTPKRCGVKAEGQNDCVLAKDVGITEAYTCLNVERKICTDMKKIMWSSITTKITTIATTWHLNTAYPADNDPGAGSCKELYPYVDDYYQHERRDSRRGSRRESRRHMHRGGHETGAEYIARIIKLFTKQVMNDLNTKEN